MRKAKSRSGKPPDTARPSPRPAHASSRRVKRAESRVPVTTEVERGSPTRRDQAGHQRAGSETGAPAKAPLQIPPLLLEGDAPAASPVTGAVRKYALGPTPPGGQFEAEEGELPEAYGRQRLVLLARDPHWLYAHWDLTREQHRRYNALSSQHHLVVRVHIDTIAGQPVTEVNVHPESRHWFIQVERAG